MSFISYAQNFEDVILMRALGDIEKGFYVDVGAWDPSYDSVTRAFYDRGWRGINIEPVDHYCNRLRSARPRDINIQALIGAEPGQADFYIVADSGLSTMCRETAERHAAENGYALSKSHLQVKTLTGLCREHEVAEIHFLKIDAEGAEKAVLEGLDLSNIRPWIILAESTLPNTQEENHREWEQLLLAADYDFAYFDGLNRFYVAREHVELMNSFRAPPNVFDHFECSETQVFSSQLTGKIKTLNGRIKSLNERIDHLITELDNTRSRLEASIAFLRQKSKAQEERIRDLEDSLSWRITKPLRAALDSLVRLRSILPGNRGLGRGQSTSLSAGNAKALKNLQSRNLKEPLDTAEIVERIYQELDAGENNSR